MAMTAVRFCRGLGPATAVAFILGTTARAADYAQEIRQDRPLQIGGDPFLKAKFFDGWRAEVAICAAVLDTYRMYFSWRPKKSIALVKSRHGVTWSEPQIVLGPEKATGWEDDLNRPVVV